MKYLREYLYLPINIFLAAKINVTLISLVPVGFFQGNSFKIFVPNFMNSRNNSPLPRK